MNNTMERNLCVPNSVADKDIHSAWRHLFGNNSIERIEHREDKKIIHLFPSWIEQLDEDEEAEILDMYEDLDAEGRLMFSLQDPSIEWWIYGRETDCGNNTIKFEVFF